MWDIILKDYIYKHSDQIRRVTRPLRERLDIEYFTYHHIAFDGRYTVLVDRPDWAEHYVGERFYAIDPYLRNPRVYTPGLSLWTEKSANERYDIVLESATKRFGMGHGICLIDKTAVGIEFFGFAGKHRMASASDYLNEIPLLKQFSNYFKKKMAPLLSQMSRDAFSLPDMKGKDYHCKDTIRPEISAENRVGFLSDLDSRLPLRQALALSRREKDCLHLMLQGMTAARIAEELKLSKRTVEHYFENIKNKLCCTTKSELFALTLSLKELGLLETTV